jgi:two-component system cell cycle sensor histidine kinase/response regulator CckA
MRLLVVDDHPECRAVTARFLACLGHEVLESPNAASAEALVAQEGQAIDVVLLDLFLDDSDGFSLADRLGALHPALRVLFVSGGQLSRALGGNRRRFLEKPFALGSLEAALGRLLADP